MDNLDWKSSFGVKNIPGNFQSCLWSNQERDFEDIPWRSVMQDFGTVNGTGNDDIGVHCTDSVESIECLLSSTYSNTDTSVEDDDGISMIFSDCRKVMNFSSSTSGESKNIVLPKEGKKIIPCLATTEAIKEGSSDIMPKPAGTWKAVKSPSCQVGKKNKNHQGESPMYSMSGGGLNLPKSKKTKITSINFQQGSTSSSYDPQEHHEPDVEAIAQMKEMIYRAAAFRPVHLGLDVVEKPKRKNVRISSDPQTVAARQRRERISERIRVLQQLVPGGNKMDTASMLDEAANYLKFLRSQVKTLESIGNKPETNSNGCNNTLKTNSLPFSASPLFNQSLPMQTPLFAFPQYPNPTLPTS